jgi:hypothetical protein
MFNDGNKNFNQNQGGQNFNFTRTTSFFNPNFNQMDARDIFKEFFGGKDPFENFGKFGSGFGFDNDEIFGKMNTGFGKSPFDNDPFFKSMGSANFNHNMGGMGMGMGMGMGPGNYHRNMSMDPNPNTKYNMGHNPNMNFDIHRGNLQNYGGGLNQGMNMGGSKSTSIKKSTQIM